MKGDFEMFVELTNQELMNIDGGINWGVVAAGAGIVGLGLAIAATGGLATVPVAVILGAGTGWRNCSCRSSIWLCCSRWIWNGNRISKLKPKRENSICCVLF